MVLKNYALLIFSLLIITVSSGGCNADEVKSDFSIKAFRPVKDTAYRSFLTFGNDTSIYIRENFINRSSFYTGKPLAVLLARLEVPVVTYNPMLNSSKTGVYLSVYSYRTESEKIKFEKNPEVMIVYFRERVPRLVVLNLIRKSKKHPPSIKDFYANLTVSRIDTVNYPFNSKLSRHQIDSIGKTIRKY